MLTTILQSLNSTTVVLLITAILAYLILTRLTKSSSPPGAVLPPGPPRKFLTGNLHDVPRAFPWIRFKELSDQYGPIMSLKLAGKQHIILSTEKAANDLLRERGAIYSSREQKPAVAHLLSRDMRPLFLPNNDLWKNGRKFMHHVTNVNVANSYQPNQSLESITMLRDLIREPARYQRWFNRYSAGIIYRLAYGKAVITGDEKVVRDIHGIVSNLAATSATGAYLVDQFPFLLNLPKAIAPFKQKLERLHKNELNVFRGLMKDVETDLANGEAAKSWERDMVEQREKFHLSEDEGAYLVGTLFEAGAGTTAVAMHIWLLAIVHHPEWLHKIQEEIDSVVGPDRLPVLEDMPELPTVRAVLKESMRWRPVFPDGVPHMSTKDDTYNGHFIPAGSIVHANNWAIHHDPELYPDPDNFKPERWLEPTYPTYREPLTTYPNLHNYSSFGFGRRICPGQNIAERSLMLLTARVAWSCDISKSTNEEGKEITPPLYDFTSELVSEPKPFTFDLKPRDPTRVQLIEVEHERAQLNDPIKDF